MTKEEIQNKINELQKELDALKDEKSDIKRTRIGNLEWSENLGEMSWEEANKKCKELGGRLPTRIELIDLFDNHYDECLKLIKDDCSFFFWSSTEHYHNTDYALNVFLNFGYTYYNAKFNKYKVRCCWDCGIDIDEKL